MILNHKDAIEFLVSSAGDIGFNRYTILNLHAMLANNLLADEAAAGRLRRIAVGIERSAFHPLEIPAMIEECFDQILATAAAIADPFEQAFFAMVQFPYLQPFDDVNKRVSRLAANIPLIKRNLCPLSFTDVPRQAYTDAVLGVYELNRVDLLKDVFIWAYERSAARYAAVRQSLGEPDPFRLRHRAALRDVVAEIVQKRMGRKDAARHIAAWVESNIDETRPRALSRARRERTARPARRQLRPLSHPAVGVCGVAGGVGCWREHRSAALKIFWSWQSDTPGKVGRFLIRDALQDAITELKQAPEIEEPTTQATRESMHLDHDIKNVPGSPDLARTILGKIGTSAVVVADVTLIGAMTASAASAKKLTNSNVAIELGYAYRALGDDNVVLVFNAHYGTHDELPFDLRHKGGAVVFDLPPDADNAAIKTQLKKLAAQFADKLRPYLRAAANAALPAFQETPSTYSGAAYFDKGEILAELGEPEDRLEFSYESDRLAYIRLVPTSALAAPIALADLRQAAARMPMLWRGHGALTGHNRQGAIAFEPGSNPPKGRARLTASTQLFPNGELWSISTAVIVTERGERPAWIRMPFVHSLTFEQLYYDTLRRLIAAAESELGLKPPWQVELGLVGVEGVYVVGMPGNEQWGPIRKAEIVDRMILNENTAAAIDALLLRFYALIYDATGYQRPSGLHGFPQSRPSG